jgi:hypothetical protein
MKKLNLDALSRFSFAKISGRSLPLPESFTFIFLPFYLLLSLMLASVVETRGESLVSLPVQRC